ncbi:related to dynamin-like protein [Cephalotrichum gorgonifer]|uniref:dynamin GTPase n=1 Tax=Cephalotrichum gorgonifer TaxID=2041049 RepID=A0AAE8MSH2_9PEZI|nr:related to dynamin-like protein [Cephalotrichum gorgonifer]
MSSRILFRQAQRIGAQPGLLRPTAWRRVARTNGPAYHNGVLVRNASFSRFLPKLAVKFLRIPAMFGGVAVEAGNYAVDVFNSTKDAVSGTASTLFSSASDIAKQTMLGFEKTRDEAKETVNEWMQDILKSSSTEGSGGDGPNGRREPPKQSKVAAGTAAAAALAYDQSETETGNDDPERDEQMMALTKEMIEIRNILQKIGKSSTLTLPSIVVIGSQSSGKSSVLEAIVGHEFLPKGLNMVTRRPIELTLVNTPASTTDYSEFPDLGLGKITDFSSVQRTLTELNLAVPDSVCVSDDPIRLTIYSPNVPDLSLIDLPGYIQVAGENQPLELKQKISELCDKYIKAPNVILAVSAADVDLANSAALRASRRVDPRGERTIGVVTKMDLVDPDRGASILNDRQYPLRLGYVGVVAKAPAQSHGLFKKGPANLMAAITKNEEAYFSAHDEFGPRAGLSTGTTTLRKKLINVLEQTMSASLRTTGEAIERELKDTAYKFKSQFNDRPISAETYLSECLDDFKHSFRKFKDSFGLPQLEELLKNELDQKILDLLAERYWNKPIRDLSVTSPEPIESDLADLPKSKPDSPYWARQLEASASSLTECGVGHLSTVAIKDALESHFTDLVDQSRFRDNPLARRAIVEAAASILNERFYPTVDGVEHAIKPYKFRLNIDDREWKEGREHSAGLLQKELKLCESALKDMEKTVGGGRKLKDVMSFVDKARRGDVIVDGDSEARTGAGGFSADLLAEGRKAVFLRDRAEILHMRLKAVKSRQCGDIKNKAYCPEVFLDAVARKLTSTAILFLDVELLSEFYGNMSHALDVQIGRKLSGDEVERFAMRDPKVRRHLEMIRRKDLLEQALEKMNNLRRREGKEPERRSRFGLR